MDRAFVTGSAGFVGQHLVRRLRADGCVVTTFDRKDNQDVLYHAKHMQSLMAQAQPSCIYHCAALADVSRSLAHARDQLDQNCLATLNVLEAMRTVRVPRIVFTSSAVVYGDVERRVPPGRAVSASCAPFPRQTSIYGAMKLASESLIQAYAEGYGIRADIFRLVSLVGEGYKHGNVLDFYRKLRADPTRLEVIGSRTQQKYYCYVGDLVEAIRLVDSIDEPGVRIWDVSHAHPNTIQDSIDAVTSVLKLKPEIVQGPTPWAGNQPTLKLDTSALRQIGWSTKVSIVEGLRRTVEDFIVRGL